MHCLLFEFRAVIHKQIIIIPTSLFPAATLYFHTQIISILATRFLLALLASVATTKNVTIATKKHEAGHLRFNCITLLSLYGTKLQKVRCFSTNLQFHAFRLYAVTLAKISIRYTMRNVPLTHRVNSLREKG